jgi:hypothetical protein
MPCGCAKKTAPGFGAFAGEKTTSNPEEWGPSFWRIIHCMAAKVGFTGSDAMDIDQARAFEFLIAGLCLVLPCIECQGHCREYVTGPGKNHNWLTLRGADLRNAISSYFVDFHNAVRIRQGKEPVVDADYSTCEITKCDYDTVIENITFATRVGWVKRDYWKRWLRNFNQLRLLVGL